MKWIKNCVTCRNEFSTDDFLGLCCSKPCKILREEEWKKKNYRNAWTKLRFQILKRDNFTCQYCGRNPKEDNVKLEIDHVHPKSKGRNDNKENLVTSCHDCNIGKLDSLLNKKLK